MSGTMYQWSRSWSPIDCPNGLGRPSYEIGQPIIGRTLIIDVSVLWPDGSIGGPEAGLRPTPNRRMATISEALAIAVQHHQAGRLQAAEQIYRQILAAQPNQPTRSIFWA